MVEAETCAQHRLLFAYVTYIQLLTPSLPGARVSKQFGHLVGAQLVLVYELF